MIKKKRNLLILLVLSILFQSCNSIKATSISDGCISDFRITLPQTPNCPSISFTIISSNINDIEAIAKSPETKILISGGFFNDTVFHSTEPILPVFQADSFAITSSTCFFGKKIQAELDSIVKQTIDSIKICIINKDKKWIFTKCNKPTIAAGIPCAKCDIEKVKIVNDHLDSLSIQMVSDFLCTFDSSCTGNAEYSSWSNETLFKVMQKEPTLFFQVIEREFVNSNLLFKEMRSPIKDGIDLQLTYDRLKTAEAKVETKARYLDALKVAAMNGNIVLKE